MYAPQRQETIAGEILARGSVSVADLADLVDVSPETIRRDLGVLEREHRVRRVHGGAVPYSRRSDDENSVEVRLRRDRAGKTRIAAAAARYLPPDGGSVIVDAGTTTALLADHVTDHPDLSVVTNSLLFAQRLAAADHARLRIVGGRIRGVTQSVVGADAVADLTRLRADVAFLGTNGVTPGFGFSTPDPAEGQTKAAMVHAAHTTVVLADASKLGEELLYRFADVRDIDVLITDASPDHPVLRELSSPSSLSPLSSPGLDVIHA
ncbi:MAG TPA: DeoR/GlpR transcriptional regulator [Corynebacterium nuruki]|uniref:Lactose phosphotransferase system repressor n=1 Tax=Corynebacterium nuruki TaxID=1032851 RepID=A0A3D4SZ15_9CORY|nr:DeoR/GlpR transcriptional regulator [Corynebacterium nuruki]